MKIWMAKTWVAMLLCLALLACAPAALGAGAYRQGDRMADFTCEMADGTQATLYGLLEEKDAVLINLWASWCGPCQMEFPALLEAYGQMQDEIGVLALSAYEGDTVQVVAQFQEAYGLEGLPMGCDSERIFDQFGCTAYPTSVLIDRFGTVCYIHQGAIFDSAEFVRLFEVFTGEDYTQSVLLDGIPAPVLPQAASSEALSAALNAPGSALVFESREGVYPMLPCEDGAAASNADVRETMAEAYVAFDAQAGDVLTYEYRMGGEEVYDMLFVMLNGEEARLHTGSHEAWTPAYIEISEARRHEVRFLFSRGASAGEAVCMLRNVQLLTGEDVAAFERGETLPQTLEGHDARIEVLDDAMQPAYLSLNGEIIEPLRKYRIVYAQKGSVPMRIRLGKETDPGFAAMMLVGDAGYQARMIANLDHDGEGFLFDVDLSASEFGPAVYVYPEYSGAASDMLFFALSQQELEMFLMQFAEIAVMNGVAQEEAEQLCLMTEDGTVIYPKEEEAQDPAPQDGTAASESSECTYTVVYVDEAGRPVEGVMTQYCDEGTCLMLVSDADGKTTHTAFAYPYEIHVLMAPQGYAPVEEAFVMPETGGEITIMLEAAE